MRLLGMERGRAGLQLGDRLQRRLSEGEMR